jgi:uncharacterized Fe-S cluster-containing radical SAM superfamily protein
MRILSPALRRSLRNACHRVLIPLQRLRGRQYVPQPEGIFIEVSSACNLRCVFCASRKKSRRPEIMPQERFERIVTQAVAYGFRRFYLCPTVGEVYMDRALTDKLRFLESAPGVEQYEFVTNFIPAAYEDIDFLFETTRLSWLAISIYGHDAESFGRITNASPQDYSRFLSNLRRLADRAGEIRLRITLDLRTYRSITSLRRVRGELADLLGRLQGRPGITVSVYPGPYSNWGGLVAPRDVEGLDLEINPENCLYKNGACQYLFSMNQVLAGGEVIACECRDARGELKIGDLNRQTFEEIYSPDNLPWMDLIRSHEAGAFPRACRCCDYYRSIYLPLPQHAEKQPAHTTDLEGFLARLRAKP